MSRAGYLGLAAGTIAAGLAVHFHGAPLGRDLKDILGDVLWAAMIVWWTGLIAPRARPLVRGAGSYLICCVVEFGQLIDVPLLNAVRGSRIGHLFLGSGFDPRDLVAYAAGVALAIGLDAIIVKSRAASGG